MNRVQLTENGFVLITVLLIISIVSILGLTALRDSKLAMQMAANAQFYSTALNLADSLSSKYIVDYNLNVSNNFEQEKTTQTLAGLSELICFYNNQLSNRKITNDVSLVTTLSLDDVQCPESKTLDDDNFPRAKALVLDQGCLNICDGFSTTVGMNTPSCRLIKITSQAEVSKLKAVTEQWVSVIDDC